MFAATAGGFAAWYVLLPPAPERPSIVVSGSRTELGDCLSKALRTAPELATGNSAHPVPLVSILGHPGSNATRVVFEGNTRLSFVVTLTETAAGRVEARLLTLPAFDPGPVVNRAVTACTAPRG